MQKAMPDGFFRETFGPLTEWVVIVRHSVADCVSLYEKAGGLPEGGLFMARARSLMSPFQVAE